MPATPLVVIICAELNSSRQKINAAEIRKQLCAEKCAVCHARSIYSSGVRRPLLFAAMKLTDILFS